MRVPLTWLRSYCDPGLSATEVAERLDLTGTELERIEQVGKGDLQGFGRAFAARRVTRVFHPCTMSSTGFQPVRMKGGRAENLSFTHKSTFFW